MFVFAAALQLLQILFENFFAPTCISSDAELSKQHTNGMNNFYGEFITFITSLAVVMQHWTRERNGKEICLIKFAQHIVYIESIRFISEAIPKKNQLDSIQLISLQHRQMAIREKNVIIANGTTLSLLFCVVFAPETMDTRLAAAVFHLPVGRSHILSSAAQRDEHNKKKLKVIICMRMERNVGTEKSFTLCTQLESSCDSSISFPSRARHLDTGTGWKFV